MCDGMCCACSIGGINCGNKSVETIIDGCGYPIHYCQKYKEKLGVEGK